MKCPYFDIDPTDTINCRFCSAYCEYRQKPEQIITINTIDYEGRRIEKTY